MSTTSCVRLFSPFAMRPMPLRTCKAFISIEALPRTNGKIALGVRGKTSAATTVTPGPIAASDQGPTELPRLPRSVQSIYLRPLRREAPFGVPSCDLQLRSYSVRNLEFFADFALRAAYYFNLPTFGPVPLPRITERWTVPKSNFIFKKAQENFERTTMRRLIQIRDGHPETVQLYLAFLKKHAYYGIGMKANIWEYNELFVRNAMDVSMDKPKINTGLIGRHQTSKRSQKITDLVNNENFRLASNGSASMINS